MGSAVSEYRASFCLCKACWGEVLGYLAEEGDMGLPS